MVHIDINPVEISYSFKREMEPARKGSKTLYEVGYQRYHVSVYGVEIFVSAWEHQNYGSDEYVEYDWRNRWEQFLGESFKKWAEENVPREED